MSKQLKLSETQMKELVHYAPENHPAPTQYINMVNTQIMGTDRQGNSRPIQDLFYFLQVAKRAKLDPTLRQIYAVYRWDKRQQKEVMSIQTGIDGLRATAEDTGYYGGSDDAVFEYDDNGNVLKATITVYKLNPHTFERMAVTASAHYNEYKPSEDFMWNKMPHVMLGKVAEALALRKAFPILSGIYTDDEMKQADALPKPKSKQIDAKTVKPDMKQIKAESDTIKANLKQEAQNADNN